MTLCVILCAPKPTGQRHRISITRWRCASGTRAHVLAGKWESEDPTYDIHWREISSTNRTSLFDSAEDKGAIEPCGPTKCGWDIISDEGSSVEDLRDLIDVVYCQTMPKIFNSPDSRLGPSSTRYCRFMVVPVASARL